MKELEESCVRARGLVSSRDPARRLHGYALRNRDIFDARAARDWEMIFAMFQRRIPAYT